jgi:hypothetical protein
LPFAVYTLERFLNSCTSIEEGKRRYAIKITRNINTLPHRHEEPSHGITLAKFQIGSPECIWSSSDGFPHEEDLEVSGLRCSTLYAQS